MALPDLSKKILDFLKQTGVFSTFPSSLLLIGLEELLEKHFLCPCIHDLDLMLIIFIFIGTALFIFALMYVVFRACRHGCCACCAGANDDTQQNCPKAFASCFVPPVMWIFILFLDGDYVACGMTNWDGVYVFDEQLNRSWCKPTDRTKNETGHREFTRKCIYGSKIAGYIWISAFSVLAIIVLLNYDCCISGKCDCCKRDELYSCISIKCGHSRQTAETQNEDPVAVDTGSGSSATAGQQEPGSSPRAGQGQQEPGSSQDSIEMQELNKPT